MVVVGCALSFAFYVSKLECFVAFPTMIITSNKQQNDNSKLHIFYLT